MPEQITISIALANQLLAYLGTHPYQQVAGLISSIQKEAQGQIPTPEEAAAE